MSEIRLFSVAIPAHNEEGSLPATIHALEAALVAAEIPHEILVVNDHSTDGTVQVLDELCAQYPALRYVNNERKNGFGNAVHTALDTYAGDAFCLVMADGSDDPQDVVRYYQKLLEGYECVFGTRFAPESKVVDYPKHKLLINRLANLFVRVLFGLTYNDITNAFKCYRRNVIDGIRPILSPHFNLTVELPLKAIVRGFSYAVIPINWYGRAHGVSKLRIQEMGSRYLFIVLYVLLERLLSRGDYVRTDRAAATMEPSAPPARPLRFAWLAIVVVAALQFLFAYTYPLNHLGGDTSGYEFVLINRVSDLLFAPGYMYLAGLPLTIDSVHVWAKEHTDSFREILQWEQHAFEILCLAFLLVVLARVYNRRTAVIAVLIAGTSARAMGVNSSVYPEWLQANLLILALCFGLMGYTTPPTRLRKTLYYALAFATFTWSVLTKFNGIVFLPGLLALLLFEKIPWRRRAAMFAIAFSFAFLNYAWFLVTFHKPRTGTYTLTCDRSWVLLTKLAIVYDGKLPHPQGIESKRWLALSSVLPPAYQQASVGMFVKLDSVPDAVRAPMRRKYGSLLHAGERALDEVLRTHQLPANFQLAVSSITVSYWIGLRESDELGVRVFRESVRHAPEPYLRHVLRESLETFAFPYTEPTFPDLTNITGVTERLVPAGHDRVRLVRQPNSPLPYDAHRAVIWTPGLRFFTFLAKLVLSRRTTVALMMLGFLLALWHGFARGWSLPSALVIALGILLLGFDVFSNAILEFRWKEWRLAYPIASVLLGITFGWAIPELVSAFGRLARAKPAH